MKSIIITDEIIPFDIGIIILKNILNSPLPSILAASISSFGNVLKNDCSKRHENGMLKATYGKINPK